MAYESIYNKNQKKIEPFLENAKDVLIGNEKLNIIQKKALLNLHLTPIFIKDFSELLKLVLVVELKILKKFFITKLFPSY